VICLIPIFELAFSTTVRGPTPFADLEALWIFLVVVAQIVTAFPQDVLD